MDGVVLNDNGAVARLLEAKCPITCRKKPIWDSTENKFIVGYITGLDGFAKLKTSNCYYTQCQLQTYVTQIGVCDLYLWSPHGSFIVEVLIDHEFLAKLIPRLESFYFKSYLPGLCNEDKDNVMNPKVNS